MIGHQTVEIRADTPDFLGSEHVEWLHETQPVELRDLIGAQAGPVTLRRGSEPQIKLFDRH
jgi:hypothetical protein